MDFMRDYVRLLVALALWIGIVWTVCWLNGSLDGPWREGVARYELMHRNTPWVKTVEVQSGTF